ncbi:MAG: 16S rRNA (guanine(527)-N(7))-methyltransferase RsmG [Propionibacteriaceae bacterium]|jgi:16S rRNA (guanine527-N7)-methyltransferase|nr:16S rRNA (guanine(527)-N(7))-methyltransferase RsmG [Propionibacteriaceae bacterium]
MDAATLPPQLRQQFPALASYVGLLANEGIAWGLIGPNEAAGDRLWERHVLNSLAIQELLPTGCQVVDVGSGAGLPGIPLAITRPDLEMTLLDPKQRRVDFLALSLERLGLGDSVRVVRARAEEHRETYSAVVSRALARFDRLLAWCWPLVAPGGSLIALKGASAAEEVAAASQALRKLGATAQVRGLSVPGTAAYTWAVVVEKAG